jgi:hypothetical protein
MKRNIFLLFAVLLTLTFAGNALAGGNDPQRIFKANVADAQVVPLPALDTDLEATARIVFDKGMRFVRIVVKISRNVSGVTDTHLHLGEAGTGNGLDDIVVTVKELDPPLFDGSFTILEVFLNTEIAAVGSVNNIVSLYDAMRKGRVYLDVHTADTGGNFPNGEIRGQIFPAR